MFIKFINLTLVSKQAQVFIPFIQLYYLLYNYMSPCVYMNPALMWINTVLEDYVMLYGSIFL